MFAANLGLLVTAFAWGSMIPVITILLRHWDPFLLAAARYGLGSLVLLLILQLREPGRVLPIGVAWWRLWLLGGVGIGLFGPLFTLGIAHSNPITVAVVNSSGPLVSGLVAWIAYRVPLDRGMAPALALAIPGGVLATIDPGAGGPLFELRGGEVLMLMAIVCWSWYSLAAQHWLGGMSQLRITTVTMIPGAVVLVAIYVIAGLFGAADLSPALPRTSAHQALFAWMVFAAVVAGVLFWHYGVRTLGIVFASLVINLVPVFAILLSMVMLDVEPTALQLVGGSLVLAGVLQAQLRPLFARWGLLLRDR